MRVTLPRTRSVLGSVVLACAVALALVPAGTAVAHEPAALAQGKEPPVIRLPIDGYFAQPGDVVRFDASRSYSTSSVITEFAFDFDGDGVFEVTGPEASVEHVYPVDFAGQMQVRVTTADGGVANHSVPVWISSVPFDDGAPEQVADLAVSVLSTDAGVSTVALSWTPVGTRAETWAVMSDGMPLLRTDQSLVTISDVPRSIDVTFSVAGITAGSMVGDAVEVRLPAEVTTGPVDPGPGPAPTSSSATEPVATASADAQASSGPTPVPAASSPAASVDGASPDGAVADGAEEDRAVADAAATGSGAVVIIVLATALVSTGAVFVVRRNRRSGAWR